MKEQHRNGRMNCKRKGGRSNGRTNDAKLPTFGYDGEAGEAEKGFPMSPHTCILHNVHGVIVEKGKLN